MAVYNLEVEQAHTYFVLAEDARDAAAVWVHNANYVEPAKGAKPRYSPDPEKWVKNGGTVWNEMDGTWVYQNSEGVTVRYPNGFPDFEGAGLVGQSVNIKTVPDRYLDFISADAAAPLGARLPTNTWHHHENLTTMQEIDWVIHAQFTHQGGVSLRRSQ